MSRVTRRGARAPGTSTAPTTRSAAATSSATASWVEYSSVTRPARTSSSSRRRARLVSSTATWACIPAATIAALIPTMPPPSTTTEPGATPATPPSSTPRPPMGRSRWRAPACTASRPAISLIGASRGSRPARVLHRLVGDGRRPGRAQGGGHARVGGQVQVGEQHLVLAQQRELVRLGLLDLEHQVAAPGRLDVADARPDPLVGLVGEAAAVAGAVLDPDRVPGPHQLVGSGGGERDAVLVRRDLARNAHPHLRPPARLWMPAIEGSARPRPKSRHSYNV